MKVSLHLHSSTVSNQRSTQTVYKLNSKKNLRRKKKKKKEKKENEMTTQTPSQLSSPHTLRSLYRSLLRELPRHNHHLQQQSTQPAQQQQQEKVRRGGRLLSNPTPLQKRIRTHFSPSETSTTTIEGNNKRERKIQLAQQILTYTRAQRTYVELLERYNPGWTDVDQQERVRLTARRVGMDMPITVDQQQQQNQGNGGKEGSS